MPESVGIRFKQAGPIYSFDPAGVDLDIGDLVIVETTRGQSMGKVTTAIQEMPLSQNGDPLKLVVRKAEPEEISKAEEFKATEGEALEKCAQLVAKHELPMKLVAAEYNFDGSHLTIYFSAENKVDFRALLKELGTTYKTRVELRQIGARDVTKLIGGLGRCGRPICCSTHLSKFDPISVRMARDQSLTLNPAMISGICGKLLCCLKYEHGQYLDAKKSKPAPETKKAIIEPEDSNGDDLNGAAAIVESEPIKAIEITTEVQTEDNPPKEKPKIFRRKRRRRKKGGSPGNDRK